MIKISVPKDSVSIAQISAVNRFEEELTSYLKTLLRQPEYSLLRVAPSFELIKRTEKLVRLNTNSTLSDGSEIIKNKVLSFIKEYDELEIYLQRLTLVISLSFRKIEKDEAMKNQENEFPNIEPIEPDYSLDQVILPFDIKKRILEDLRLITHMPLIYDTWKFSEVDKTPRLVLSFYGEPGTGKTKLAHGIAKYFGKKILLYNYSDIESKYIGDAAKNLKNAFDNAKANDAVLFFDEADSFLGKRIQNVSQGAEQAINSLRSQMLILLERHQGIVLFATNLIANFDKAFESRFIDCIKIPMPDRDARVAIIKELLPSGLPWASPLQEDDYYKASDIAEGIAGREIKNAILRMMLENAEDENHQFIPDDLFHALSQKVANIKKIREEIESQGRGKKINASPEQLEVIKGAVKNSINKS